MGCSFGGNVALQLALRCPEKFRGIIPVEGAAYSPGFYLDWWRHPHVNAAQVCASCHGEKGLSETSIIPSLAGQTSYAIYKQLHDYRTGARVHEQMTGVAQQLAVEDLASIAAYFAASSTEYAALGARDFSGDIEIVRMAWEGDTRRRIPACMSCHTNGVGGPIETPTLAGQNREYMAAQLHAYADGTRKNDVYGRMRDISRRLTPEEREQLARYFQGTL